MQRKALFVVFSLLFFFGQIGWCSEDSILQTKSQLLVQKGQKAEARGEIEEAVASYEEAYTAYPKNILPLLLWAKALCRIGLYERAGELLDKIPLEKLPAAGKSEVYLLKGKIALAEDSLEDAAAAFSRSVKASKTNASARIRLATVNEMLSLSNRADELLQDYDSFEGLSMRELVLSFFLDLRLGNLGRAFATCGDFCKLMAGPSYANEEEPFLLALWKSQLIAFFSFLPLTIGGLFGIIYFVVLFGGLLFVASRLSPPTAIWHDLLFVLMGTGLMIGAQTLCKNDLFLAAMSDQFSENDAIWVVPRLVVSGNLIALGLFIIFPAFRLLPEEQRPKRFEYYGVWFFCWFFMIFVLVFQSRMAFGARMAFMGASAFLALISSFFMPLGRFILYKIADLLGMGNFAEVHRKDINNSTVSFTDAKILESKAGKLLEKGDWQEVVLTARKIQSSLDKKTFPQMWKAMIFALIAREDYIEAQKGINEFLAVFNNTALKESGQLLDAYLKSCKGDFASALKLIRGFSDDRVKGFSQDETALSLLILGRCDQFYKENVQAHIDLNKAFYCAKLPILKAESLVEIVELDFNMNAKDSINKWKLKIPEIFGGPKSAGLKKTIGSIAAMSEGDSETALKLAAEACNPDVRSGRACAWYGHLLCLSGRSNAAEDLLGCMTPDSADAARLMTEVTGTGA